MPSPEEFARRQRAMLGPSWRAQTAAQLDSRPGMPSPEFADESLRSFGKYLRLQRQGDDGVQRAAALFPTVAAAERLNGDLEKAAMLKLMVVADLPYDEMHGRTDVVVEVMKTWESLYFDARNQLQATSWLSHQVIDREVEAGNAELAAKLKLAILVGPVAVRGMLDMQSGICLDEADKLFQRRLTLSAKFDVAASMPVDTEKSCMFFIKTHVSLMAAENRQALAERKLAQRCTETRDRFEHAKLKKEQASEFEVLKENAKLRKAERRASREALRRQAARELDIYHEQALQKMQRCRVAESPLALLRWTSKPPILREQTSHPARIITNLRTTNKPRPSPAKRKSAGGFRPNNYQMVNEQLHVAV